MNSTIGTSFVSELAPLSGTLVVAPGAVAIISRAPDGWEDKLNGLTGVQAVRLDDGHVALQVNA